MSDLTTLVAESLLQQNAYLHTELAEPAGAQSEAAWDLAFSAVEEMSPAELGIISATGKSFWEEDKSSVAHCTPLWVVLQSKDLWSFQSGRSLLKTLAAAAVIARMKDLVDSQIRVSS